ncbi:MAG TPA: hypothetical protein VH062_21340, partial [Polyangiaceae bacterium]|nr:hypothetical protein [Polyangiaceae bacterium]
SRSNPEVISRALTEEAGMPVEFQRFSSNTQRYEDALLIADQLPPSFRGVVVLTVTDYKRDYKPKDTPKEEAEEEARLADRLLAIDAPSLAPVWAKHHFRRRPTGVFFVDHLRFFAARRIAALPFFFTTRPELPAGQLIGDPMADADRVEKAAQRITKAYGVFRRPAPILTQSREVLRRTLDNLRARGIQVVVLEAITNPLREVIDAEGHIERYRSEVAEFAEEHGAVYWDFNADLDFAPEDFQDDVHLGSQAARRKFQHTLVSALAALIVKDFPDGMATEVTAPGP